MNRRAIQTAHAPAAIGPYSQAVAAKGFVFCAGQIGIRPDTGQLVAGGIEAETEQALKNLDAVLTAAGSSLAKAVKTTVFLSDLDDFPKMNAVYARFFRDPLPARATVEVSRLPKGACVEIEVIAVL